MADNTLSSAAPVLYEMRGPMQANYPCDGVLLATWSGNQTANGGNDLSHRVTPADNRKAFDGSQVRVPIDLAMLQAAGFVSETGTVNAPIAAPFTQATITLKRIVAPASISLDLKEDSSGSNSAESVLPRLLKKTREALAEVVNDAMNGNGDGLLGTVTDAATSLTITVDTTTADFDKLYVGKVVDVRTRSTGADPGQGLRRRIASFVESTGVITFDTAQQASDGGLGNIVHAATSGIYTAGSYGQVMTGLEQAANFSQTDTFQTVVRSTYPQFSGIDGRAGITTTTPLSDPMLDAGTLLGNRGGTANWDFGIGDPNSINVYKNGKLSLVRYDPQTSKIPSGFSGINYDGTGRPIPLVPERKATNATVRLLRRDAASLYGRAKGPDFDDATGSIEMRFARALPTEFWLVDRVNWGWHNPASIVTFGNLSVA